jgi:hypothetical protein
LDVCADAAEEVNEVGSGLPATPRWQKPKTVMRRNVGLSEIGDETGAVIALVGPPA